MLRYKACKNSIVTLELLNSSVTNEKRDVVDADHAKFRCDKAKVIDIVNVKTGERMKEDVSIYSSGFHYRMGEIVKPDHFSVLLNIVCAEGIHYFKTKETAISWYYRQNTDTIPDGKYLEWYDNGNKKSEKTIKNKKVYGKFTEWWDNGNKYCEGTFGGEWIYYHANGTPFYIDSCRL